LKCCGHRRPGYDSDSWVPSSLPNPPYLSRNSEGPDAEQSGTVLGHDVSRLPDRRMPSIVLAEPLCALAKGTVLTLRHPNPANTPATRKAKDQKNRRVRLSSLRLGRAVIIVWFSSIDSWGSSRRCDSCSAHVVDHSAQETASDSVLVHLAG